MSNATLANVDRALLRQHLSERGEPAYRAGQVWEWAARGATGYEQMTNLPDSLRRRLEREVPFSTLEPVEEAKASDGTVKALFRTHEGHPVEAVLMRHRVGARSICLTSQSGCPLTCTFCATGQMRFRRNLTASEMLDQALHFRRLDKVNHAVFMGMGEPMLNLDEVLAAARRLPELGITHRRTTVSTVGWLPGLHRFVDEVAEPVRLALSLHAPTDELRSELMPVNDRYPLAGPGHRGRGRAARRRTRVTLFAFYGTFTSAQPGHGNLAGARFVERTRTVPRYRLFLVDGLWPALVPVAHGGVAIECELYDCS